ncbi:MAG TPA: FMN-binding protein [Bauldia sp.]|nr:FMN-binding protein [Bauldia sp.]
MKKVALSLFVIAASGAYVWSEGGRAAPDDPLAGSDAALPADLKPSAIPAATPPVAEPTPPEVLRTGGPRAPDRPLPEKTAAILEAVRASAPRLAATITPPARVPPPEPTPVAAAEPTVPLPRLRPAYHAPRLAAAVIPASMTLAASTAAYADGTYTGPVVDAYYGLVQIQAIVQGGQLVGIKVLQYPSDRRTSVFINRQALPMLRDEVVSAQSANVDIVSGATLTSEAFIRSLSGALRKAKS